MIHKEASNAYKYGIAYQIKKKNCQKKKFTLEKLLCVCTCGLVS